MDFPANLLDFTHTVAEKFICDAADLRAVFTGLSRFIFSYLCTLGDEYVFLSPSVAVHKTAVVAPSAFVGENVIIGPFTEIRHCAYIRGNAVIGERCVVGNSTEIKNSVLFDGVQVPHFNYVGDSILGFKAHLGAGAVVSNVKSDRGEVSSYLTGFRQNSGLKKLGAVVGDYAEIGCGSVLNPGAVIGKDSTVYPLSSVRGFVPAGCIYKSNNTLIKKG